MMANTRDCSLTAGSRVGRCMPIEVGCRGFAGQSFYRADNTLGINGAKRRRAISSTIEAAEKASRYLWIKRGDPWEAA